MAKSYINVYRSSSTELTHTFIEDGVRKREVVQFQPLRGYHCNTESEWKDIYGRNLTTQRFDSMYAAAQWEKENKDLFDIYGSIQAPVEFITEFYHDVIKPQKKSMNIYNLDIEVYTGGTSGFPKPHNKANYISAVTFQNMVTNQYYAFGLKDYTPKKDNVHYYKCKNELHLIDALLDFVNRQDIDVLTGWNIEAFDIPYIVNRITFLMGEEAARRLSPDRTVTKDKKTINKREVEIFKIQGIIVWDYYNLYQKFTFDKKERYTLDYISQYEKVAAKIDYHADGYESIADMYDNDFDLFMEYNIMDVECVYKLDQKMKFLDIAIQYTYMMKCDPDNIFGTVRPWDAMLYNELYYKKILCSPNKTQAKSDFVGGYVREPERGMANWVTVYDIVSSYPNQIISSNLSPEMIVASSMIDKYPELVAIREHFTGSIEYIGDEKYLNIDACLDIEALETITETLDKYDLCFTPNGQFFRKDRQGFIPEVVQRIFKERVAIKGEIKRAKEAHDKDLVEYLESRSLILKICINSLYGCTGSEHFRYYDVRLATAVTWQGQLCARGVAEYVIKKFPSLSWKYSDTDSIFLSLERAVEMKYGKDRPDIETIALFLLQLQEKRIDPVIDEYFVRLGKALNTHQMTVKMEHECLADMTIFIEKKKYAMKQVFKEGEWFLDKLKLKIKGIEIVRTSTPQCCRDVLKTALELIFTSTNAALIELVDEFKEKFYSLPFEDVAFPRGANFKDYKLDSKSLPIAVRAAMIYNRALKDTNVDEKYIPIGDGDKIKFAYIRKPSLFHSDVLGILDTMPTEWEGKYTLDYKTQFEKAFMAPLAKIVKCINWQTTVVASLESFFD